MATHLGTESAGSGHTVEVGVSVLRHVVVEHDVHPTNIGHVYVNLRAAAIGKKGKNASNVHLSMSIPRPKRLVATRILF